MFDIEVVPGAIIGPFVGFFLTLIGLKVKKLINLFPSRKIWKQIMEKGGEVSIAVPSIEFEDFPILWSESDRAKLPKNVTLVGLFDALAVADLNNGLRNLFKDIKVTLCSASSYSHYDENIISIGGSSVNKITRDLLQERKVDKSFEIKYPEHVAIDSYGNQNKKYTALKRDRDESIAKDYGFIIVAPSPFNYQKYVCILQGIWPFGTWAAAYCMVNPKTTGLYKKYKLLKNKEKGFLAIIEVSVADEFPGVPQVVDVREVDVSVGET
ncbi:hypothetical protein KA005_08500 [bacterium]|nr:hypothetical protein [bacterium]